MQFLDMKLSAQSVAKNFRQYLTGTSGQVAAMLAISMPMLMGGVGLATDFAAFNMKRTKLQAAADQAAIAGARELSLSSAASDTIAAAAESFAKSYLNNPALDLQVKTVVDEEAQNVKVTVSEVWTPFFAHFIGADVTPVVVSATAGLFGESKLCVLALTPSGVGAISMTNASSLQATSCTVYSNSDSSSSVYMGDAAKIDAGHICSAGGVKDNGGIDAQKIVTDCPVLADPLASRPRPKFGACDFGKTELKSGTNTLTPGVYCGGVIISGDAVVEMDPGEYIFNGPLVVKEKATLRGDDVGLFMTGSSGLLHFMNEATIDLNGRESGAMAGMLIFDDPLQKGLLRTHSVSASNARNLTGTIYTPNANFIVDPSASVAQDSAYTAIVAKRLIVQGGPTLVLNTNYSETSVPVPDGIKSAADIHLVE